MSSSNLEGAGEQLTPEQQAYNQLVDLHAQLPDLVKEDVFNSNRSIAWADSTTLTLNRYKRMDLICARIIFEGLERSYFEAKSVGLEWYNFPSVSIVLGNIVVRREAIKALSRGHRENHGLLVPTVLGN